MKTTNRIICLFGATILSLMPLTNAGAKQTSLDSRIFQAFENIDERTKSHEQDVVSMRARLDKLATELEGFRMKLSKMPASDDPKEQKERRLVHGQLIQNSAEYLNQSYKLVDSAAAVISANLSDLAKLSAAVRSSGEGKARVLKLQKSIQQNISAGRSMRNALVELRQWAKNDTAMSGRYHSLMRITRSLDRRISIDKARLPNHNANSTGAIRDKRLAALDQSVDRLGDMYAEITTEKELLKDLRDELAIAIQLARLDLTQQFAERAIPKVDVLKPSSSRATSLENVAEVIGVLSSSLRTETDFTPAPPGSDTSQGQTGNLGLTKFSNF